jgi:hypothetical protein
MQLKFDEDKMDYQDDVPISRLVPHLSRKFDRATGLVTSVSLGSCSFSLMPTRVLKDKLLVSDGGNMLLLLARGLTVLLTGLTVPSGM